jgi:type IV secretion system protein VirB10
MNDAPDTGERPLLEAPVSRPSWFTPRRIAAIGALGVGCAALLIWLVVHPPASKPEPVKPQARTQSIAYDPPPKAVAVAASVPAQPPPPKPFINTLPSLPPTAPVQMPTVTKPPQRPAVYTFGQAGQNNMPEYMKPKPAASETAPAASTAIAYKSATISGAKTATIQDRNLLLMPGPLICIMDTAINTDVAGPFQCHLSQAALSPTNVTLMEQGTKIQGGYTSGAVQGQSRVIAVTANAITPNGIIVPLGGPIADELGAGGVEGTVDNHWLQRLGGALLLSLVDSAFSLAQTELQKAGSTNLNISTGSGVGGLASQLLAKTINIPPTITLSQGTTVALWNPGIIDFSPSYKLEMTR